MRLAKIKKIEDKKIILNIPGDLANEVEQYKDFYNKTYNDNVKEEDIIKHIVMTFINEDKSFIRHKKIAAKNS